MPFQEIDPGERTLRFALAGMATWRLTHLLALEDGPADVIVRLRMRVGRGKLGELMDCFDCLSIWVAACFVPLLARRPALWLTSWLALSGTACAVQRLIASREEQELDAMAGDGAS